MEKILRITFALQMLQLELSVSFDRGATAATFQASVLAPWTIKAMEETIFILSLPCFFNSYIANQQKLESINDNEVGFYIGLKNL